MASNELALAPIGHEPEHAHRDDDTRPRDDGFVDTVKRVLARIDQFSLDLARDVGTVTRDAQALADSAASTWTKLRSTARATPRVAKIMKVGTALIARYRWHRIVAAAKGRDALDADAHRDLARRATAAAAELRGGIAKIGQVASCRPDLFGAVWSTELSALQDRVPPVPTDGIRARIEAELGQPVHAVFDEFSAEPVAAASLAQVHRARLRGTDVAVKVQVPGIEDIIDGDIAALRVLAGMVGDVVPGADLSTTCDELMRVLGEELDYRAEAAALERYAAGSAVAVPRPIAAASSARVLTMTWIAGERLVDFLDRTTAAGELAARDRVLVALVEETVSALFDRGFVHGDPHPGNVLVDAAGTIALLDFGCTLALAPDDVAGYARLMAAIVVGDRPAALAELVALGFVADDPDALVALAERLVVAMRPGTIAADHDWDAAVRAEVAALRDAGPVTVPRSFVLIGRILMTLAGLFARYRPAVELHAVVAPAVLRAAAGGRLRTR
jgi:predicted unusual protein kinase regulating ubiquinone biosynthesis (AarF/ABC1/UbiB family)